ncbi:related to SAS10 protein, involved in silencing [Rhynchosporium agropyri]|uniref:Related to SAS10 protein, involved in silencing n=1 Tax=Rhynchosporium agropyri TaxID=914238 RepID=A0A1E1JYE9_9HELO|nr:related to SAS10 protein, involved in silencing [Rhynchosporium agropyri]
MPKKRKAAGRFDAASKAENGFEAKGGKMGPITSYEDVADSEDEFHISRDKVLLDEGPDAKRRRKYQEEDLEPSDEEILGYSSESDDDEVEEPKQARRSGKGELSDDEEPEDEEEEEEGWGTSRRDYYNNDEIQTEADALEEEAEAKRLQQKKLQKMSEADFGFDESEWLDAGEGDEDGDVVTEVLKDVEITSQMGPQERLRILQTRYPEFEFLANEFLQLQPVLEDLQNQVAEETSSKSSSTSSTVVKARALAAYLASLTMYFAILTSPAKGGNTEGKALDPVELRDHAVMDSLLQCRGLWIRVKTLQAPSHIEGDSEGDLVGEIEAPTPSLQEDRPSKKSKKERTRFAAAEEAAALRAQRLVDAESELADLSSMIPRSRKSSKKSEAVVVADDDSDFGEEETMDAKSAEEKAAKKKSLRFYTSQITQKSNKRADAGRDAGGDADLPHRERLRDRQARLNAEAEKRGKKLDEYGRGTAGADLGGDSDSGDENVAEQVRGEEDEYYDMVAKVSKDKKLSKEQKMAAIAQAKAEGGLVRVVEGEVGEDGKRAIGYVIEKNKGLAPKRKKDVRNPRVKKRKKYEEKKKKLASTRAVYKGGEERGGYGGEKTGIKPGLVKSIKLG